MSTTLSLCSLFGGRAEQQLDVSNAIVRPAVYSFMLPVNGMKQVSDFYTKVNSN